MGRIQTPKQSLQLYTVLLYSVIYIENTSEIKTRWARSCSPNACPIIIVIYNYYCFIISFIYHLFIISVLCEILQATENIIVNFTSTAMGSNATYQCRDGSSDVYTTQCTSDGVWEPNPNSTLDCIPPGKMSAPYPVFYL